VHNTTFNGSEGQYPAMWTQNEPTNALDLALDKEALFTVKSAPMGLVLDTQPYVPLIGSGKYQGEPLNKGIYREFEDDGIHLLNITHPSFPESNYLQVIETAEALFPETTTGMMVIDNGERLLFSQEIGDQRDLGGGDTIQPSLLWTASLNSTWSSGCHGVGMRAFCANQLPMAHCHFKARRTLNHDQHLAERSKIMATLLDRVDEFTQNVSTLKSIEITTEQFARILNKAIPAPVPDEDGNVHGKTQNAYERKIAAVRYYFKEESEGPAAGTAWAAWNAVQSAESHDFTKGKNQEVKQAEIVMNNNLPLTNIFEKELLNV